jgi:hypothetical protein
VICDLQFIVFYQVRLLVNLLSAFICDCNRRTLETIALCKSDKTYLGIMREATELDLTLSSLLVSTNCHTWDCHLSDVCDGS